MNYSQDPEIEAASSLVVTALKEFYEQGDKRALRTLMKVCPTSQVLY